MNEMEKDWTIPEGRTDDPTERPTCNVDGCDDPYAVILAPEGHLCEGCAEERHADSLGRIVDMLGRRTVKMGGMADFEPTETPWLRRECHECSTTVAAPEGWVELKTDAKATYACPGCGEPVAFAGRWDGTSGPPDEYEPIRPEAVTEP